MSWRRGRRAFFLSLGSSVAACGPALSPLDDTGLQALERDLGGRVGVYAQDDLGRVLAHRADERFPMCSTFKWLLAAAVLTEVDEGRLSLQALVPYREADLLDYAPTTREHLGDGALSIEALCEAAVTLSDNTAANLLLPQVGGPAGLTAFLRKHDDTLTRLDRDEPSLNENVAGDPRDTTTPRAMAGDLRGLLTGDALSPSSRDRLLGWLEACATCDKRVRAGLPAGWKAANKTGTGPRGASGDVGVFRAPGGHAVYLASYLSDGDLDMVRREKAHATVGSIVAELFA